MQEIIINAYSLDASSRELYESLLQNEQLGTILTEFKKNAKGQKIAIGMSPSQRENFQGNLALDRLMLDPDGFIKLHYQNQGATEIIDLSTAFNQSNSPTVALVKGPVNNPGIHTCTPNTPLTEIIYGLAGGLKREQASLKAVLWGGSFGALIKGKYQELALDKNTNPFGVGDLNNTLIVIDDLTCMVNLVKILTLYNYQKLSKCSHCSFCPNQLAQAQDILQKITDGMGTKADLELLHSLVEEKEEKALCLLGKKALLPLETALKAFGDEFTEHIINKYCQASVCQSLFLSACTNACPAKVDLPGTIGLMQKGLFVEAVTLGRETNPFLLTCGRICEEPLCQKYCQRQTVDKSVHSRALHRYAGEVAAIKAGGLDKALDHPSLKPVGTTDKKVAIIGAGPAGLSAAYFLARYGHKVTVFEKLTVAGGMLRVGIPDYRLPPEILNQEINHILSLGVEIRYNTQLGKDITISQLQKDFDALYLAIGAHQSNKMAIPGEDLPGVYSGIEFLSKVNLGEKIEIGKRVVVVGGGNVAIDAARCALRLGATETKIVYRRSLKDMPAAQEEIAAAREEGVEILPLTNPAEISGNGKKIIRLEKMKPGAFDNRGRPKPIKSNEFFQLPVDTVIIAIGQSPQVQCLDGTGIETKWDLVQVDHHSFETNLKGVFAGGDCVLGPATAVEAIGQGRRAAEAIQKYLMPDSSQTFTSLRSLLKNFVGPYSSEPAPRQKPQELAINDRIRDFREVEKSYTDLEANQEMNRCICSAKTGL